MFCGRFLVQGILNYSYSVNMVPVGARLRGLLAVKAGAGMLASILSGGRGQLK